VAGQPSPPPAAAGDEPAAAAHAAPPLSAAQAAERCAVPSDLLDAGAAFPHVAGALRTRRAIDVLAIGSATMLGPRGGTEGSFPYRMTALLRTAFPGVTVRLTVQSGRGLTAVNMLASLRTELAAHSYDLVLWQTATVEAVRNLPPDELFETLSDGAGRVRAANADLVLIDPQYSRFLRNNANLDPYLQVMQQAASLPDVVLFRRFDLMKYWVDNGQIDLERAGRGQRQNVADTLHDCLGLALAQMVTRGAAPRP
jgi:hypothetical protein